MQVISLARWRLIVCGLVVLGSLGPVVALLTSETISPRSAMLWFSFGLICVVAAFATFEWSERSSFLKQVASWETAVQQMRSAGLRLEQMQRRFVELDANTNEIRAFRHILNEERHNLSLVASGMVEIRGAIDKEQTNLGTLATAVHDLRSDTTRLTDQAETVFADVGAFGEIVVALRAHLDAVSSRLFGLEKQTAAERTNLGHVASGLDALRHSTNGVERFEARQAAFEDILVSVADQIDALRDALPTSDQAA